MKNSFFTVILIVFVTILITFASYMFGRFSITNSFKESIENQSVSRTLGSFISNDEKKLISKAFKNPSQAYRDMDLYSWEIPTTITPFVGTACRPGHFDNAFINTDQFRSINEIDYQKSKNEYRIFITGGSTAFGSGTSQQDKTIGGYLVALLNKHLSKISNLKYTVFTMAAPAWSSTHERIMIENRLSEMEPDLIISFSGVNDVHWGARCENILWFRTYKEKYLFSLINQLYELCDVSLLPDVTSISEYMQTKENVSKRLIKNIQLSQYALSLKNIKYIYILQPTLLVKKTKTLNIDLENFTIKNYFQMCYNEIDSNIRKLQLPNFYYFNLSQMFDGYEKSNEIFIDSYHFGDRGNEIIAQTIFKKIKKHVTEKI